MNEQHEPLMTDPRSYESEDGDILPLDLMIDPIQPRPDSTEYSMTRVPNSELEGPTTRLIRQALAQQAMSPEKEEVDAYVDGQLAEIQDRLYGKVTPAETEALKNENLDVATALRLLHKETGFYARSNEEKNAMQAIMGRSEAGFPTLRYLDEVEYHQRKANTDDPTRALRSIARSFEEYAVQAHMEVGFSRLFKQSLDNRQVNMNQKLSQNISMEDILNDDTTRRTLTSLARLREVDLFVEGKTENPLGVNSGIDSLKGKERNKRMLELLDTMQLRGVVKLNERLITEQNNRFDYWKDRIGEARMRSSIRAQVDLSLEKLNKLRPTE